MRAVPVVTLVRRPDGAPVPEDFEVTTERLPQPAPGHVHLRVRDLSLDPYLRSLLGTGHLAETALPLGAVVPGRSVAEVLESGIGDLAAGSLVLADTGWRSEAIVPAGGIEPVSLPDGVPPSAALSVLGMPGLTAYAAHVRHVAPRVGDTVVAASATGGVGVLAGALARLAGARAVALVGSAEKADLATSTLGYHAAVVRTEDGWADRLREACPRGIDGYLHMGDQATLDVVMEQLAIGARVSLIGVPDQNNGAAPTRLRIGALMAARATAHGMVVYDHADLAAEHRARVGELVRQRQVPLLEDRYVGLDQAPYAFSRLMTGRNVGKVVVEVS